VSSLRDTSEEMVPETISITAARERLTGLVEQLNKERPATVQVTRRGEPVLAIMPWALYESIAETLEILGDEELMAALRQSIREIQDGDTYTPEEIRAELGL